MKYELEFGRDEFNVRYVAVRIEAPLTLICQRSLEPFVMTVNVDTRLGLIVNENEESGLPPGYEPLLVEEDGRLDPVTVIEDELLLVLPLVPINPDAELPDDIVGPDETEQDSSDTPPNPFAILRELKNR
ncbi:YceD family protein [Luteibacter rhizovicinus]|uniref:YceD family protein n=1 Tax=Luteibacter rhizovicinus TaxID=242606 RepID=UPI0031B6BA04